VTYPSSDEISNNNEEIVKLDTISPFPRSFHSKKSSITLKRTNKFADLVTSRNLSDRDNSFDEM